MREGREEAIRHAGVTALLAFLGVRRMHNSKVVVVQHAENSKPLDVRSAGTHLAKLFWTVQMWLCSNIVRTCYDVPFEERRERGGRWGDCFWRARGDVEDEMRHRRRLAVHIPSRAMIGFGSFRANRHMSVGQNKKKKKNSPRPLRARRTSFTSPGRRAERGGVTG